nr:LysM domain-containing protein [Caldilineaceae bacterium]
MLYGKDITPTEDQLYALQTATNLPNAPSWVTPVGQPYRLLLSDNVPALSNASLSISYQENDVPFGEEEGLTIYYYDKESENWQMLPSTPQPDFNYVVAPVTKPGLYALMSSTAIALAGPGWNVIGYPIQGSREVSEALASIAGEYSAVFGYDGSDEDDPWKLFLLDAPTQTNELRDFVFGQGYLVNMTDTHTKTLLLRGNLVITSSQQVSASAAGGLPMNLLLHPLPAVYYGEIAGTSPTATATTSVVAYVDSTRCAEGKTWASGETLMYLIKVPAATPGHAGCGASGKIVTFRVAGQLMAAKSQWNSSEVQELTLEPVTYYVVQRGDNLTIIAERFGVTVRALAEANQIYNINLIRVGQRLMIPR